MPTRGIRSSSVTSAPALAALMAAIMPEAPPPMTVTVGLGDMCDQRVGSEAPYEDPPVVGRSRWRGTADTNAPYFLISSRRQLQ